MEYQCLGYYHCWGIISGNSIEKGFNPEARSQKPEASSQQLEV
jgi:hypothetical protein